MFIYTVLIGRKNGPTVLQTRSEVERKHILTERISEILMADESITQKQNEEQEYDNVMEEESVLKSRLLQDLWSKVWVLLLSHFS